MNTNRTPTRPHVKDLVCNSSAPCLREIAIDILSWPNALRQLAIHRSPRTEAIGEVLYSFTLGRQVQKRILLELDLSLRYLLRRIQVLIIFKCSRMLVSDLTHIIAD